jgi:hypothetical protein
MEVRLKLYRPLDRFPSDHFYGEPFDTVLNDYVGGEAAWSSPRADRLKTPRATLQAAPVSVSLHEDGPLFQFIAENASSIAAYTGALASVVSAWAAIRPKKDEPGWKRELQIRIDQHVYHREGAPDPDQIAEIAAFIAQLAEKDWAVNRRGTRKRSMRVARASPRRGRRSG